MDPEFAAFLSKASRCRQYEDVRAVFLDQAGSVVGAAKWGIVRLSKRMETTDLAAHGISDAFLAHYEEAGHSLDPLLQIAVKHHIAVHSRQDLARWDAAQAYRELLGQIEIEHVILAPVVGEGSVVATLNFGRERGARPFDEHDIIAACAVANHMSALLARVDSDGSVPLLTEREIEIGRLVARGLNNREIAVCLGITTNTVKAALKRIFFKLQIDARAELAVRLSGAGLL